MEQCTAWYCCCWEKSQWFPIDDCCCERWEKCMALHMDVFLMCPDTNNDNYSVSLIKMFDPVQHKSEEEDDVDVTVKSRLSEWPLSAHSDSLCRDIMLNRGFLMWNSISVTRFCILNWDVKLNWDLLKRDFTVLCSSLGTIMETVLWGPEGDWMTDCLYL